MALRRAGARVLRANSRRVNASGVRQSSTEVAQVDEFDTSTLTENDPPSYKKFPPALKPMGVPDTWKAADIETDLGFFEDDCFPPALPGETLEEYCRRVPNVWSPCSRSTDVVDCPVYVGLEFAQDVTCEDHQFSERPLVKIPPLDSDWHAVHEYELDMANPDDPYTINGIKPPMTSEGSLAQVASEEAYIMQMIREGAAEIGHGHWFQADNFNDFWLELTGKTLGETPMDGHLLMWLEQNPGKTLNEIAAAIDPMHEKDDTPYWNVTIEELKAEIPELANPKPIEGFKSELALKMPIKN